MGPDVILVGFPGHADMLPATLYSTKKQIPVVFDAFVSLWETSVEDRAIVPKKSLSAMRYRLEDRVACSLADLVLLDTDTHIDFFVSEFALPREKFRRVWVGADDEVMFPRQRLVSSRDDFRVFFYGSFSPLHGADHIVRAAALLQRWKQKVSFVITGSGQTYPEIRALAAEAGVRNMRFLGRRPYSELPVLIAQSELCLGIFGATPKAERVVPNKIFDALACRRPVVTSETSATRECLTHGETAWFCESANPEALAAAIVHLKDNKTERRGLEEAGYRLFKKRFSLDAISMQLREILFELGA